MSLRQRYDLYVVITKQLGQDYLTFDEWLEA